LGKKVFKKNKKVPARRVQTQECQWNQCLFDLARAKTSKS